MSEKHRMFKRLDDIPNQHEMQFYNSRYFAVNKIMMTCLGLWPYQNKVKKLFIRILITFIIASSLIPQIISAIVLKKNVERLIQAIGTFVYVFVIGVKFLGTIATEAKLKFLYKSLVHNWNLLESEAEKHILRESSEMGRLLTIGYVGYMLQAAILFVTLPAAYHMFNVIWPLSNGSRPPMYILDGEYLVDRYQYYYYIYIFESFTILTSVPLVCTVDSTYALCIQQCVGLFDVVKLRLELATKQTKESSSFYPQTKDVAYEAITKTAKLHEKVLNFGRVLESSYSSSLLFVMICNALILAIGAVNIIFHLDETVILLRFFFVNIGFTIHMFYVSWPGQKMIDKSSDIFYAAYNNEWYECSMESQKLLKFIMQRTEEPFYLTSGGFYIMNFQNFISLFKTSVSYITVLASFTK